VFSKRCYIIIDIKRYLYIPQRRAKFFQAVHHGERPGNTAHF
jgi:hypothetical protein